MPNIGPLEIVFLMMLIGVPIVAVVAIVLGIKRSNEKDLRPPPPGGPGEPPPPGSG